ncbi:hypothetical protein ACR77J_08125 [Tissierella praeacuta]|uniref:hypothetical protein n=1 Tax=Tissierella praeacuta TaxID=43131 RepID=UPI003DA54C12
MWIQKIITKVWYAILPFLKSRDKCLGISIEHKDGDSHTIVRTLYYEGDFIKTLNDHLTYLK